MAALGVPAERIVRMASGVDAEHFHPGTSNVDATLPPRPRVVFTGRLHPQKNLDLLLDVWPVVARRTGAHLVLVGGGPDRDRLAERARDLQVAEHVHPTGPVADPADYLRAADVFALPSVAEGMSNSLLEAMSTALPCLASAIGGNTDLLDDGRCGLLVAPDDRDAWTAALIRVLEDKEFARALGETARQRIESEFALPVVVDRYVALYHRLLAWELPREIGCGGIRIRADVRGSDPRATAQTACRPRITTSRNSRARRARASTPLGSSGRGMTGAKMFSQQSGIVRPVKATGCSRR